MSVINEMLQQLDRRRAAPASAGAPLAPVAAAATPQRRLAVIVAAGTAAIGLAAYGDWPSTLAGSHAAPMPAATGAAGPTAPSAAAAPAAAVAGVPGAAPAADAPAPKPATTKPAAAPKPPASDAPFMPAPTLTAAAATMAEPAKAASANAPAAAPATAPAAQVDKKFNPASPLQRAQALHAQAVDAAGSGHRQTAIERATEALKFDPALHAARHLAAVLLVEAGRAGDAEALIAQALNAQTPAASALLLAQLVAERGDAGAALALLERQRLTGAEADGLRAALLAQQGDFAHALPAYEAALRRQPDNATWWAGLAVALEAEGQPQRARAAYERAAAIGLPSPDLAAHAESRLRALP
jgi:MSHA biogenesis protein MshN